jgi:hypothetical protein
MPAPLVDSLADVQRALDELWDLAFTDVDRWMVLGVDLAFAAGWTNFGGGYRSAAFRRRADGDVEFRGLAQGGSGTMFTLPSGYRPEGFTLFPTVTAGVFGYIQVSAGGVVTSSGALGAYVALDSVRFEAVQ